MCSRPITQDDKTFSCRKCNDCIAARRSSWIARAMMEKATNRHAMVVALTYDNSTLENRDAAEMFQYADIQAFLKRLRRALWRKDRNATVRFLVAGEQGDEGARCHWHAILYTSADLLSVGEFHGFKRGVYGKRQLFEKTDRSDLITVGKREKRINWSLWPHGYATFQEPDIGGMSYVLTYVLKDQFTTEASKDTMRENRVANFSTGLFRMSKRPSIGEQFFWDKFTALDKIGAVLPSLNIKVPEMDGYYHPSGSFRKLVLWSLVALNKRVLWATGHNAPQWSSLVASLGDKPPDLEILCGKPQEQIDDEADWLGSLVLRGKIQAADRAIIETRRKCGRAVPCKECLNGFDDQKLESLGLWRRQDDEGRWHYHSTTGQTYGERSAIRTGANPDCQLLGSRAVRAAFPRSGADPAA